MNFYVSNHTEFLMNSHCDGGWFSSIKSLAEMTSILMIEKDEFYTIHNASVKIVENINLENTINYWYVWFL
jgi:hypothetical protein